MGVHPRSWLGSGGRLCALIEVEPVGHAAVCWSPDHEEHGRQRAVAVPVTQLRPRACLYYGKYLGPCLHHAGPACTLVHGLSATGSKQAGNLDIRALSSAIATELCTLTLQDTGSMDPVNCSGCSREDVATQAYSQLSHKSEGHGSVTSVPYAERCHSLSPEPIVKDPRLPGRCFTLLSADRVGCAPRARRAAAHVCRSSSF